MPPQLPILESGSLILNSEKESLLNLEKETVINGLKRFGFVIIRGFETNTERFKQFSNSICTEFMPYVGGAYNKRETINGDKTLLTVTGANLRFAVPLHGEMHYTKNKPDVLWFYCVTPALKDGETTVCDGIAVYNALSNSTKELFLTKKIKYIRSYPKEIWQDIYKTDDLAQVADICKGNETKLEIQEDKSIATEYLCSAIIDSKYSQEKAFVNNILPVTTQEEIQGSKASLVRFEDGSKIPSEVISELKEVTEKLTINVSWQPGDIVLVDNSRMLHGRRAFADNQREIYVRLGHLIG